MLRAKIDCGVYLRPRTVTSGWSAGGVFAVCARVEFTPGPKTTVAVIKTTNPTRVTLSFMVTSGDGEPGRSLYSIPSRVKGWTRAQAEAQDGCQHRFLAAFERKNRCSRRKAKGKGGSHDPGAQDRPCQL